MYRVSGSVCWRKEGVVPFRNSTTNHCSRGCRGKEADACTTARVVVLAFIGGEIGDTADQAATSRAVVHTSESADSTGSIETGKAADLVVIDRELFATPPERIGDTRVLMTVLEVRCSTERRSPGGRALRGGFSWLCVPSIPAAASTPSPGFHS